MVWRISWKMGSAKRRTVRCWRRGVVRMACRVLDQISKEEIPVAELIRLMGWSLMLLRCCIRRRIGV